MVVSIRELYYKFFRMDNDDWISCYESNDKLIVRFMYRSDEGHGHRTKCYAMVEIK